MSHADTGAAAGGAVPQPFPPGVTTRENQRGTVSERTLARCSRPARPCWAAGLRGAALAVDTCLQVRRGILVNDEAASGAAPKPRRRRRSHTPGWQWEGGGDHPWGAPARPPRTPPPPPTSQTGDGHPHPGGRTATSVVTERVHRIGKFDSTSAGRPDVRAGDAGEWG